AAWRGECDHRAHFWGRRCDDCDVAAAPSSGPAGGVAASYCGNEPLRARTRSIRRQSRVELASSARFARQKIRSDNKEWRVRPDSERQVEVTRIEIFVDRLCEHPCP